MNGRDLALGLVGVLALAGVARRRGSASLETWPNADALARTFTDTMANATAQQMGRWAKKNGLVYIGSGQSRGSRSTGGAYFHVTTIDGANAILRDGFRAGPGICGRGVYLWDDLWYAQQMAQDEGDDAVILAVNPEDTELYACDEADVQDEGDSAYYDHVVIARVKSRWKPKMRVME